MRLVDVLPAEFCALQNRTKYLTLKVKRVDFNELVRFTTLGKCLFVYNQRETDWELVELGTLANGDDFADRSAASILSLLFPGVLFYENGRPLDMADDYARVSVAGEILMPKEGDNPRPDRTYAVQGETLPAPENIRCTHRITKNGYIFGRCTKADGHQSEHAYEVYEPAIREDAATGLSPAFLNSASIETALAAAEKANAEVAKQTEGPEPGEYLDDVLDPEFTIVNDGDDEREFDAAAARDASERAILAKRTERELAELGGEA